MTLKSLNSSIPANNEKIIEIYQKVKSGQLDTSPVFQRKLVWKKQHKINFINTILLNYPFPEIYKAPGDLDVNSLELKDLIVDGQQRITTIKNFIEGKDVFALTKTPIKFSELNEDEKRDFLNYEVSIRYLKGVDKAQIKDIFQRINNTEYSLNTMERLNAQWGDSEFVCYAKQLIEEDLTIDSELLEFRMSDLDRNEFLSFFHDNNVFTDNDNSRMLSLQLILTLISTLVKGEYFRRNDETQSYIELYNDCFDVAPELTRRLKSVVSFVSELKLESKSYWFNKANIFTLIVELYNLETSTLDVGAVSNKLHELESTYKEYLKDPEGDFASDLKRYFEFSREGVNEKVAREHRGKIINGLFTSSIIPD